MSLAHHANDVFLGCGTKPRLRAAVVATAGKSTVSYPQPVAFSWKSLSSISHSSLRARREATIGRLLGLYATAYMLRGAEDARGIKHPILGAATPAPINRSSLGDGACAGPAVTRSWFADGTAASVRYSGRHGELARGLQMRPLSLSVPARCPSLMLPASFYLCNNTAPWLWR